MSTMRIPLFPVAQSVEWRTPEHIIACAVAMLGTIDLDPCSTPPPYAVPATLHMDSRDNGLRQPWHGTVFLNPPYGRALNQWLPKLRAELTAGRTKEAIVLVPASTETQWFATMWQASRLCFVRGRLRFGGASVNAPFPSVIGYFGRRSTRFVAHFADVGQILRPERRSV